MCGFGHIMCIISGFPHWTPDVPCVLLAGPPGAGKSTLGKSLAMWLHIPHISTGETLRALPSDSTVRASAQPYLERGELVPAHIMLQVVHHRLSQPDCASGYILDGYPVDDDNFRHCNMMGLNPTDVIILEVSEELSVARQVVRSSRTSDNPGRGNRKVHGHIVSGWVPSRLSDSKPCSPWLEPQ